MQFDHPLTVDDESFTIDEFIAEDESLDIDDSRTDIVVDDDDDDELITKHETCVILGGEEKPIDPATLYRGIRRRIYPPPKHPSPGLSRWSKREVLETRRRIIRGGS